MYNRQRKTMEETLKIVLINTKTMELKALNLTNEEMFITLCCRQAVNPEAASH